MILNLYEIYTKAMSELLDMKKNSLLSKEIALNYTINDVIYTRFWDMWIRSG